MSVSRTLNLRAVGYKYSPLQFANVKNLHCVSMASLGGAKLANPLTTKAYHCSLGSANKIKYLVKAWKLGG
jgi:hypothetical protein